MVGLSAYLCQLACLSTRQRLVSLYVLLMVFPINHTHEVALHERASATANSFLSLLADAFNAELVLCDNVHVRDVFQC